MVSRAMAGPDLKGVTQIRKKDWLKKWLKDPSRMRQDPIIQAFRHKYPVPMPETNLSSQQIEDLIAYLSEVIMNKAKQ